VRECTKDSLEENMTIKIATGIQIEKIIA